MRAKMLGLMIGGLAAASCGGGAGGAEAAGPSGGGAATAADGIIVGAALPVGQLLRFGAPLRQHPSTVRQVAIAADGALVSASESRVRVWEPGSGALRWQSFKRQTVARFALGADGATLAVAHSDPIEPTGAVTFYELGGKVRASFTVGSVVDLAISPDGTKLAVTGSRGVGLYDVAEGTPLAQLPAATPQQVAFAGEGAVLLVGKDAVQRWSWRDGKVERVLLFERPPQAVALSRDGGVLAWDAGEQVRVVALRRTEAEQARSAPRQLDAEGPVQSLALSPLGDAVAVGRQGGVAVWALGEAAAPRQRWRADEREAGPVSDGGYGEHHAVAYPAVAFSSTGQTLVAAAGRQLALFDADRGRAGPHAAPRRPELSFYDFALDGSPLLWSGKVERLQLPSGARTPLAEEPFGDAPEWVNELEVGGDGLVMGWELGASNRCQPLRVWRRGAPVLALPAPSPCEDSMREMWFPGAGLALAAGEPVTVWSATTARPLMELPARPRHVERAAFSANRRWLVVVYGVEQLPETYDFGAPEPGQEAGPRDDGRGESSDALVEIFELPAAETVSMPARPLAPRRRYSWSEPAPLAAVAILHDGTVFAGAEDGVVVAAPPGGRALEPIEQLASGILLMTPSPTGAAVAVVDEDGQTILYSGEAATAAK